MSEPLDLSEVILNRSEGGATARRVAQTLLGTIHEEADQHAQCELVTSDATKNWMVVHQVDCLAPCECDSLLVATDKSTGDVVLVYLKQWIRDRA